MGAGSLGEDVGEELVLDGGVLLGAGLVVLGELLDDTLPLLGGVLLGTGLTTVGGAFGAEWVGSTDVFPRGIDLAVVLGAGCVDGVSPDLLGRPVLPDLADIVSATGAKGADDVVWRLSARAVPAWPEGGATLLTG